MAKHIFSNFWGDGKDILDNVASIYCFNIIEKSYEIDSIKKQLEEELRSLQEKLKKIIQMRIEDEITKIEFLEYKDEIKQKKSEIIDKRSKLEKGKSIGNEKENPSKKVDEFLTKKMDFSGLTIDRDILMKFVDMVQPKSEDSFDWYLDFDLEKKN